MKNNEKYFIIKRNSLELFDASLCDLIYFDKRKAAIKRYDSNHEYLLIEKTNKVDAEGETVHCTNLWSFPSGLNILFEKYTKGRMIYDYSGIELVIHYKNMKFTWDEYNNRGGSELTK